MSKAFEEDATIEWQIDLIKNQLASVHYSEKTRIGAENRLAKLQFLSSLGIVYESEVPESYNG